MESEPSPTIEEPTYVFIDDEELQKDFMSGANLTDTNIPTKVYFYIYNIVEISPEKPFLKVFLSGGGAAAPQLDLPSVDITPGDVLGGDVGEADLNILFLEECMEKFTTDILKDHEIATNYTEHYKGFVLNDNKIIIVFHLPASTDAAPDLIPVVIDEIINKKQVGNTPIHENVRKFLYNNLKCLYITTDNFENFEIPQVFYGDTAAPLTRTVSDFGFFYKFSSVPSDTMSKKYVGFIENRLFHAKDTNNLIASDINKEFEASVLIEPEGKLWYFKSAVDFFAI